MGNENAKGADQTQVDGTTHDKCKNGGVNGISVTITANGHMVEVPTKFPAETSETSEMPAPEPDPTEYAVLESQHGPTADEDTAPAPEPDVPSEDDPPKEEKVSLFNKMFKKKAADKEESQPNGKVHGAQENGLTEKDPGIQVSLMDALEQSVHTESTEYVVLESHPRPAEAGDADPTPDPSAPSEEVPPKEEKVSLFGRMFKKKAPPMTEKQPEKEQEEQPDPCATPEHQQESSHSKVPDPVDEEDGCAQQTEEDEEKDSERGSADNIEGSPDGPEEQNPVMNFFKTLVTPTKTTKKEAAASDAPKDQPKPPESQPAPASATTTTTVAQVCDPPASAPKGMPAPPPPPPEPPRAEPAAKAAKQEEPKGATKDSPKGKSTRDTLSRLFKSKTRPPVEEAEAGPAQTDGRVETQLEGEGPQSEVPQSEVPQSEVPESEVPDEPEQKPDASKASTLEAAAKATAAPAAAPEENKPQAKKSLFSFLKPKALLDSVTSAVQAASTSGVELLRKTTAAGSEPKAAPAPAAPEPGPAKEDAPKAKATEATSEAKAAAAPPAGEEPSPPKKMEKRNSITLFFKNLSQKRGSTDAGAQSEAGPAPSAEKTK